ncbi:MAG: hypothetical protein R3A11_04555 [Bdellovibrionota bacterium]
MMKTIVASLVLWMGISSAMAQDSFIVAQYEDNQPNLIEIPTKNNRRLSIDQEIPSQVQQQNPSSSDDEQRQQLLSKLRKLYEQNKHSSL